MKLRMLHLALAVLLLISCEKVFDAFDSVTDVYKNHLTQKIGEIQSSYYGDGFVFFTDTHLDRNNRYSAKLIQQVLKETPLDVVIFGGDAIAAYGSKAYILDQWTYHKDLYDMVKSYGNLLNTRGNHDFTNRRSSSDSTGYTYSQKECADILYGSMSSNVTRPINNDSACYYYHDDQYQKIRYIILESTDQTKAGDVYWGNVSGVGDEQLNWLANIAIKTTPSGYGIVVVTHIPILLTTKGNQRLYANLSKIIKAVNAKEAGKAGSVNFDFTGLNGVDVLMVVSGHHHHDMQTFQDKILHVTTACDAQYSDAKRDPLLRFYSGRDGYKGQCFDSFVFNEDRSVIKAFRVGFGGNRVFHRQPLNIDKNSTVTLKSEMGNDVTWRSYNADGNTYANSSWSLVNDIVQVDGEGVVTSNENLGEVVIVAEDSQSNREFFNIIVK